MIFRFFSGSVTPLELLEEQLRGVLVLEPQRKVPAKDFLDDLRLTRPQQAIVDEDARQLIANRPMDQRRGHARIHTAAQPQDDAVRTHLTPDLLRRLLDVVPHRPVLPAATYAVHEVREDLPPLRRVHHFRVELDAEVPALRMFDGGVTGVLRRSHHHEILRKPGELVSMRVPDLQLAWQPLEQRTRGCRDRQRPLAVLALVPALDLSAQELGEDLHAETDAQDRNPELEDRLVGQWSVRRIHAGRSSREDQPLWIHGSDLRRGRVKTHDRGVDVALADSAGNHLCVLRPEIKDDDLFHGPSNRKASLCRDRGSLERSNLAGMQPGRSRRGQEAVVQGFKLEPLQSSKPLSTASSRRLLPPDRKITLLHRFHKASVTGRFGATWE